MPTRSTQQNAGSKSRLLPGELGFFATPAHSSPPIGNHKASKIVCAPGEIAAEEGAVVLILRVVVAEPLAAGVAELGFNEHVGAHATDDSTEQENCTSLLNPPAELMVTQSSFRRSMHREQLHISPRTLSASLNRR